MTTPLPRYEIVSRRHFLQRSLMAAGGVAAAGLVASACSGNDAAAFGASDTSAPTSTEGSGTTVAAPVTTASTVTTVAPVDPSAATPSGDLFPGGAELQVNFSYAATDGRVRNPFIAVWIENPTGELVQSLALWYAPREARYVTQLARWYNAEVVLIDGGGTDNVESISGATRSAGTYNLVWDGTDVDGNVVSQGNYVVCVESAREHGPHCLSTGTITIGTVGSSTTLPNDTELSALVVDFVV